MGNLPQGMLKGGIYGSEKSQEESQEEKEVRFRAVWLWW